MRSRDHIPPLKRPDGSSAVTDVDKVNALNSQFSSVFTLDDGILPYFGDRTNERLHFVDFSAHNVFQALGKLFLKSGNSRMAFLNFC